MHSKVEYVPSCSACGLVITQDIRALQCDGCGETDVWKCAECLDLSSDLYDKLLLGIDLKWLCTKCEGRLTPNEDACTNADKLDRITTMLETLITKTNSIEEKLKDKADKADLDALEAKVAILEVDNNATNQIALGVQQTLEKEINQHRWSSICDKEAATESKINELEQRLGSLLDDSKNSKQNVIEYVQKAVEAQAQETKDEELEKEKRKTSIIVHGLPESEAQDSTERAEDDSCIVASMFQAMKCTDVRVKKAIRLGKYQTVNQDSTPTKPRPVKVTFESESDKDEALKMSKNLRRTEEGVWYSVFMHQDLTVKERELRKTLVQELKQRRAMGETDLIMVGLKIVKRRYSYRGEEVEGAA